MHEARTQRTVRGMLSLAIVILSLTFGVTVDASGGIGTPSATPTSTASTSTASLNKRYTGGGAPWAFVLAIVAAIAIFVIGGLLIVLRSRREYLDDQARNAARLRDDD